MRRGWMLAWMACVLAAASAAQAQTTFLYMNSEPGDFVGAGQQWLVQPSTGTFMAFRNFDNGVSISFNGFDPGDFWNLDFAAPFAAQLEAGMYEGATRYPFQSPAAPGLSVSGQGRGCNTLTGRFMVLDVVYGMTGEVVSFAADFEQHCEGAPPALYGSMRYNSSVPLGSRLAVGNVQALEYDAGTTYPVFRVALSAPATSAVTVDFHTEADTASAGTDFLPVAGTVTIPAGETIAEISVGIVGDVLLEDDETFRVVLSNPVNATIAFGEGVGTILDDDPEKTFIYFDSDPGDYIGQGVIRRFTVADGTYTPSIQGTNAVQIYFNGPEWWHLTFASPGAAPPTPGVYENATRWPFQPPGTPGLDVSGDGRGCNTLIGRFVVLEAVYGPGNTVERFAADFEQHCEGGAPALLGSVRYRSLATSAALSVRSLPVPESVGSVQVRVSMSWPSDVPVTFAFATTDGTAVAGEDYTASSGVLTIAPGAVEADVVVPIRSDSEEELDETFTVDLGAPTAATILRGRATVTIVDDDPRYPFDLTHGTEAVRRLRFPNLDGDFYAIAQEPRSSWEAVVDGTSGDIGSGNGPRVQLLGVFGEVLASSQPVGAGPSRSLRFANNLGTVVIDQRVRVQSDACTVTCNDDDTYRIRFYETTYRVARFNQGPTQLSVLVIHNPTAAPVSGTSSFWSASGSPLAEDAFFLMPHASKVTNLGSVPGLQGQSGSITIAHDAPYGALVGKVVALEPQTGFSFDTPMTPRPR